ncbi:hypothetical protein ACHAWF_016297 [Thalassiosira exigua]
MRLYRGRKDGRSCERCPRHQIESMPRDEGEESFSSAFNQRMTRACITCIAIFSLLVSPTHGLLRSTVSWSRRSSHIFSEPSEFGAISASNEPPRLSPTLVEAAFERLPWEIGENLSYKDVPATAVDEISSGEHWMDTRKVLTRLWILPRDMSNGSWEAYAAAANKGEDKMLARVPQLLRLDPDEVEASAKTVLSALKLPPAALRLEPSLLTIPSEYLVRGFNNLLLAKMSKDGRQVDVENRVDDEILLAVRNACKEIPRLLIDASVECIPKDENDTLLI